MRFIYGKQNWPTMERGQENCYLLTNGLGGFSSASMIGSNTRNDHALLMACTHAPNRRVHMIHRLEEQILWSTGECGEELLPLPGQDSPSLHLSSQDYTAKERREEGYLYLSAFCFEDYPVWTYDVNGVEVVKKVAMKQGENLAAVKYEVDNQSGNDIWLKVTPHLLFRPKGMAAKRSQVFILEKGMIRADGLTVFYQTNGIVQQFSQRFTEGLYYAYDACDGRMSEGNTHTNHCILKKVNKLK